MQIAHFSNYAKINAGYVLAAKVSNNKAKAMVNSNKPKVNAFKAKVDTETVSSRHTWHVKAVHWNIVINVVHTGNNTTFNTFFQVPRKTVIKNAIVPAKKASS